MFQEMPRPIGGSGGSSAPTLLYTNSDVGTADKTFSAQTLSLDLSGYSHVLIDTVYNSNSAYHTLNLLPINSTLNAIYSGVPANASDTNFARRTATPSSTGIVFGSGWRAGTSTAQEKNAIPYKVYGVNITLS